MTTVCRVRTGVGEPSQHSRGRKAPGARRRASPRVLGIVRKGGRATTVALAPATVEVLEPYLGQRAAPARRHPPGAS